MIHQIATITQSLVINYYYELYKHLPEITIGNRIRKARLMQNITQKEIEIALGINCMYDYEYDCDFPSPNVMKRIAEYLNTPLEYFYDDYYRFIFTSNIREWRLKNNLTQVIAAQLLKVDIKTYWQWENGTYMNRVSFEKIRKIIGA